MTVRLDDTHRADLVSWVDSAQATGTDFPIQNLPLGLFRSTGRDTRPGVAIGDQVLQLCGDLFGCDELRAFFFCD